MSTIQSRRTEKKAKKKKKVTLTRKFPWKSCFTDHLSFSEPKILLKGFLKKLFPSKWSLLNAELKKKRGEGKKRQEKVKTAVLCHNSKISIFCFLRMPELRKLIILHLDRKAAKCTTCKQLLGKFLKLVIARHVQWLPEKNGLSKVPGFFFRKTTFQRKTTLPNLAVKPNLMIKIGKRRFLGILIKKPKLVVI